MPYGLQTAFHGVAISEVENGFLSWIVGHDESKRILHPDKKD